TLPDFTELNVAGSTTFDLNGQNQTIDALNGAGTIVNNGAAAATLTVGQHDGDGTFSGVLGTGTSALALTKNGAGTQVLTGANTYTGATNINGGALRITNAAGLGSTSSGTTINGGTNTGALE